MLNRLRRHTRPSGPAIMHRVPNRLQAGIRMLDLLAVLTLKGRGSRQLLVGGARLVVILAIRTVAGQTAVSALPVVVANLTSSLRFGIHIVRRLQGQHDRLVIVRGPCRVTVATTPIRHLLVRPSRRNAQLRLVLYHCARLVAVVNLGLLGMCHPLVGPRQRRHLRLRMRTLHQQASRRSRRLKMVLSGTERLAIGELPVVPEVPVIVTPAIGGRLLVVPGGIPAVHHLLHHLLHLLRLCHLLRLRQSLRLRQ